MSYLRKKLQAIMACADFKGYLREVTGYPLTLTDCMGSDLVSLSVTGNAAQGGTPSPDAPVEVQGCGEKTGNLFDVSRYDNVDGNSITVTNTSGDAWTGRFINIDYAIEFGKTYTLVCDYIVENAADTSTIRFGYMIKNGTIIAFTNGLKTVHGSGSIVFTVTVPESIDDYNNFSLYINSSTNDTPTIGDKMTISNIQIIKGSYTADTMPPYEPYGYKIPVEVSGRNLFDVQGIIDTTEAIDLEMTEYQGRQCLSWRENMYTSSHKFMQGVFAENTQYTFALTGYTESDTRPVRIYVIYTDGTKSVFNIPPGGWNTTCVTTLAGKTVSHWKGGHHVGERVYIDIANSQILEGSYTAATIPPYEPYHEPQTVNVYTDKPLYAVGDVGDTIIVDFDTKTAVRTENVGSFTFNGSETWNLNSSVAAYNGDKTTCRYNATTGLNGTYISISGFCDRLPYKTGAIWGMNIAEECFAFNSNQVHMRLSNDLLGITSDDDSATRTAKFKAWLSANATTVLGKRATPTTTDISALQDWDAFPSTWRGTVTISADTTIQPSSMAAQYYATKKEED